MTTTIDVSAWRGSRSDADPARRLLVLPGLHYPVEMPAIQIPLLALGELGFTVWVVHWVVPAEVDHLAFVTEAATRLDEASGGSNATQTVVIGKSLGTLAAGWAAERQLPAIWLTPLLNREGLAQQIAGNPAPQLLVGGSEDTAWDATAARTTGKTVLDIPGANHGFYSGDWRHHLTTVGEIATAAVAFVRGL